MKHYLAIFAEGFYESLESFATVEQRAAYAEGIVRGALLRGGTVTAYDLPEQFATMQRDEPRATHVADAWRTASA